jgi:hypothetical protein
MLFHNPFAWLLVRSIRRERELCCDDIVLSCRQDAIEYASALLSLEKGRRLPALSMALASNGHTGQLLQRVRRITSTPAARKPYADRLLAMCLTFLLMASMAWMKPGTTQAHTMPNLAITPVVEEQKVWVLTEPRQNMLEKPRQKTVVIKEKAARQKVSPSESLQDEIRFTMDRWETVVAPPGTPVFVNEAPPEGFRFLYEESTRDTRAADILLELSNDAMLDHQHMQNLVQERAMELQHQQMQSIELEKRMKQRGNSFYFRSNPGPEQPMIIREFRNAAEARKTKQRTPTTRNRAVEPSSRPSARTVAPDAPQQPLSENEIRALADELRQQQILLLHNQEPGAAPQTKTPVKVNRVKTKDGYALRIVTVTESIDIRIGEDDLIVEKH